MRSCDDYCEEQGLNCVAAWEEEFNDCEVAQEWTCDRRGSHTSDIICECGRKKKSAEIWSLTEEKALTEEISGIWSLSNLGTQIFAIIGLCAMMKLLYSSCVQKS